MTAARQKRKQYRTAVAALAALAASAGLVLILSAGAPASDAVAAGQIVVDWHTGLAIDGYDPVAFFTEGKPTAGSAAFELRHGGVFWRFANIGNRDAFAARPDIYMPQYGGYDPIGVARGLAVAGNPLEWMVAEERLYLFFDSARRDTFALDPGRVIAPANRKWPDVRKSLTP